MKSPTVVEDGVVGLVLLWYPNGLGWDTAGMVSRVVASTGTMVSSDSVALFSTVVGLGVTVVVVVSNAFFVVGSGLKSSFSSRKGLVDFRVDDRSSKKVRAVDGEFVVKGVILILPDSPATVMVFSSAGYVSL